MFIEFNYMGERQVTNFDNVTDIVIFDNGLKTGDKDKEWAVKFIYIGNEQMKTFWFDNLNDRDIFYEFFKNSLCKIKLD